jgi:acyl carrier protein phosphodiesterase
MNWLAHLFLSEYNVEHRLGNFLADLVKGSARQELNPHIQKGIAGHQVIDIFTDSHSVVHRSKQRIGNDYRRFSGILIDVFYDHFLAKNWLVYSPIPLEEFTTEIYQSFQTYPEQIPAPATELIARMAAEDWLGNYRSVTGIETTLRRISSRMSRRMNRSLMLHPAINELSTHYCELESDFQEFFPELLEHVRCWRHD